MIKVRLTNTRGYITEFPSNKNALIQAFTIADKNAHFAQRYNKFAGKTRFISPERGIFPAGLLYKIEEWAEKNNEEIEITDERKKPAITGLPLKKDMLKLNLEGYHIEAINACLEHGRGIIKIATGGRKTIFSAALIKHINVKTLFIVERINLATQTKREFLSYGLQKNEIGIVGGGKNEQHRLITVTTIQSSPKLENIEEFQMVIVDEGHHSKSSTYSHLLKQLENAYFRFSMSGTPISDDKLANYKRLSQFGPIITEVATQPLVEAGILSKPTIRFIEINKPVIHAGNYQDAYLKGIVRNFDRNKVIINFANNLPGKTLILFKIIEHGQLLHQYIPKAGYMDGETNWSVRDKLLKQFERSTEATLICSQIVDEGVSMTGINSLIIGSGEKSMIKTIQRLGRGLRQNDDMVVNVIDFMDRTHDTLEKHSNIRMKLYLKEGHECKMFQME